jgi:hypothetical protein
MTMTYMSGKRYFKIPAGNGELRAVGEYGDLGAPILFEHVDQTWRNGDIVAETREIKASGKLALAMPAAS